MIDTIAMAIMVFGTIVFMVWTARIAKSRGRSTTAWLWLAAFFGPFATLLVWALPVKHGPDYDTAYRH
jgi:NO-binding membrane sensor protein with MHYT domain